ncbi:hypothetical protein ACHQM5_005608 [Ranunculus cassubicifolius]
MSNPIAIAITPPMAIFDELRWVIQLRKTLDDDFEQEEDIPVCIFNVPKALMTYNPEFYIPQMVSIGPYHHIRQEIKEMERYKLAAAKRTQKRFQNRKFNSFVEELTKLERRIRGCYHMYLDFNLDTLAWMMAVDTSFLLEVLQAQATSVKEGKRLNRVSTRMSHLVDYSGKKSSYNAILRDIIMLENQVPLFVLRKMLEFEHSSLQLADEVLSSMLLALCRELSPFDIKDCPSPSTEIPEISHLLGFLYQTIIPKSDITIDIVEDEDEEEEVAGEKTVERDMSLWKFGYVKQFFVEIWQLLGRLNIGPVKMLSRPLKVLMKLPWTFISQLPGFSNLALALQNIFFPEEKKPENSENANKPPLVEQIMIPSVSELYSAGVQFVPSDGNIDSISFDTNTGIFLLPVVSLDVNTEVVLRNLVAYEASMAFGPLIFTRYTELMNGIIDTEEDAKLLREKGIVVNYLKSDREIADIWNGMSKSVRLTRVPCMDKVIEDVNKFHNGRWKIKVRNFIRAYVFGSWQILALLAAIFLLFLMSLQAFCSVYTCSRVLRISSNAVPSNN